VAALRRMGCPLPPLPPPPPTSMSSSAPGRASTSAPSTPSSSRPFPLYGTAIVLPLRPTAGPAAAAQGQGRGPSGPPAAAGGPLHLQLLGGERGEVLRRRFADLSPTLLLFLQRLRRLVVRDETGGDEAQLGGDQAGLGLGLGPSDAGSGGGGGGGGSAVVSAGSGVRGTTVARVLEMERREVAGAPHLRQLVVTTRTVTGRSGSGSSSAGAGASTSSIST
jgi:hypothetical protein